MTDNYYDIFSIAKNQNLDCNQIVRNLYQGSFPEDPNLVKQEGFDVLVLCAHSHQPTSEEYPGIELIHCPFDDTRLDYNIIQIANQGANQVAKALMQDKKVLTTCHAGFNRSGLVNALALKKLTNRKGSDIVRLIQMTRPGALFNNSFVNYICRL